MSVLDSYYFCLNKSTNINISEFIRIKDQEEVKEVEKMFDNESLSKINKGIIIPMKYSHKIFFTIKEQFFLYLIIIKNKRWKQSNLLVWTYLILFPFYNHKWFCNGY